MRHYDTDRIDGDVPEYSPAEAARLVSPDATVCISGFGSVGYPKRVPEALAESGRDLSLTVISGGSVGEEVDKQLVEAGAVERRYPYQATPEARAQVNAGEIQFHDRHISTLGDETLFGHFGEVDLAIVEAVAVGEDWLLPSTSIGHTPSFVRAADRLFVEVNRSQPVELRRFHDVYERDDPPEREPIPLSHPGDTIGSPRLPFQADKLDAVVATERPDSPYSFREPTGTDLAIAENLSEFLDREIHRSSRFDDTVNIQFGVGSLGNALTASLNELDLGDRSVNYFGEVIMDGLLDLLDAGAMDVASGTSLALSEDGQKQLFTNIDRYADDIVLRPADISNNPAIVDQIGLIGINSALEVDIFGHANSTHVRGSTLINGLGGSGDYNRNCLVSVVALPSAIDGSTSRIVPFASHVDHTEHDVSVLITEQGIADLRGLSPRERAREIIDNCAHPSHESRLRQYLDMADESGGHIPHSLGDAVSWFET